MAPPVRLAYSQRRGRYLNEVPWKSCPRIDPDECRDLKEFWYPPENKWVMLVAPSPEHKIQFHEFQNLKDWYNLYVAFA